MLPAKTKSNELAKLQPTIHLIQCLCKEGDGNMMFIASQEMGLTISKTFDTMQIVSLKQYFPAKDILQSVREIILSSGKAFKFAENMSLHTATLLAIDLIDAFKNESIEDVILLMKMARQGKLGKTDGRLDADVFSRVLIPNYLSHKAEIRERNYRAENIAREKADSAQDKPVPAHYIEQLDKLSGRFAIPADVKPKEKDNHHILYLEKLRNDVKIMTIDKLKERVMEMKKIPLMREAIIIINEEIKIRTT